MSGISRLLAKELASALGITDNPKFNPMFKQTDEVLSDVADPDDPTVARFYSPLESAIENAPIGKEGTRGENVEAFVRKRAPKVSKAEMEFRGLGLPAEEKITTEGALESLSPLEVKAVKRDKRYRLDQRQSDLDDPEVDYVELNLETAEDMGLTTHMGGSSLAHTRYSVRDPDSPYILIEELQSDPIQNLVDDLPTYNKQEKAKLEEDLSISFGEAEDLIELEGSGFADGPIGKLKSYINDVIIPTRLNPKLSTEEKVSIFKSSLKDLGLPESTYVSDTGSIQSIAFDLFSREFDDPYYVNVALGDISTALDYDLESYIGNMKTVVTKDKLPVSRITDTIRMSLQAIIADAKAKGINEIVLPPVEKLAEKRFAKEDVPSKIAKGSAFYNTYVAAYEKVLKQLKAELGDQVKIGKKPLKYRAEGYAIFDKKFETKQGTLLDISNLTVDPTTTKLRFNKGGLVERPE